MMMLYWLIIFCGIGFQLFDGALVKNCKGIEYYGTIGDLATNKTAITITFNMNIEFDAENFAFPNLVTISNFSMQNDPNVLTIFKISKFYRFIDYNTLTEVEDLSTLNSTLPYRNGVMFFHIFFRYINIFTYTTIETIQFFLKDGAIFSGVDGTFFDETNNYKLEGGSCDCNADSCTDNFICNTHVARCTAFAEEYEIPESQDEICVIFENNITTTVSKDDKETEYDFFIKLFVTDAGVKAEFAKNRDNFAYFYGPFNAVSNKLCLWNTSVGCSFPSDNFHYIINLNVDSTFTSDGQSMSMIVGELIKRNGMFFKNDTHFFTKADPCLSYFSEFDDYGSNVVGYASSICCTTFQNSQDVFTFPPTPSSTMMPSTTAITSPANKIPLCQSVFINGNITYPDPEYPISISFSYSLIAKKLRDSLQPNSVEIRDFTFTKPDLPFSIDFGVYYDYDRKLLSDDIDALDKSDFQIPNQELNIYLSIFIYKTSQTLTLNTISMFVNNGKLFDGNTGKFMNEKNNFRLELDQCVFASPPQNYDCYQIATCKDIEYIDLDKDNAQEMCTNFESQVFVNIDSCDDPDDNLKSTNFTILYSITDDKMQTIVHPASTAIAYSFGPLNYKEYTKACKNNSICSIALPADDFQFPMILSYGDEMIVGEIARRNGILLRDDNVPYSQKSPCWTPQKSLPFGNDSSCAGTYSFTFCCTKFAGINDKTTTKTDFFTSTITKKTNSEITSTAAAAPENTTHSHNSAMKCGINFAALLILVFTFFDALYH